MRSKSRRELACPERGGGCEQSEQTEGLHRDCSCLRQPLSQTFGLPAPRSGSLLGVFTGSHIKPPCRGRWILRSKRRRDCIGTALVCVNPSVSPTARQLPRQGAFWVRYKLQPKSCPRLRGKWHEVPKGEWLKEAKCREVFPLSLFTIVHRQLPRKRWSLLVRFTSSQISLPP